VHEWALAEAVVETVLNYTRDHKGKVVEVKIKIGKLQSIDLDIFKYALNELVKNTPLANTNFVFSEEDAIFKCNVCGYMWGLKDINLSNEILENIHFVPEAVYAYVKCPKCGSIDFSLVKGRGVYIEEIKVEQVDDRS